jgi:hypothetical protein
LTVLFLYFSISSFSFLSLCSPCFYFPINLYFFFSSLFNTLFNLLVTCLILFRISFLLCYYIYSIFSTVSVHILAQVFLPIFIYLIILLFSYQLHSWLDLFINRPYGV